MDGLATVISIWHPSIGRGLARGGSADGSGGWSGTLLVTVAGSVSLQAGYSAASAPLRTHHGKSVESACSLC